MVSLRKPILAIGLSLVIYSCDAPYLSIPRDAAVSALQTGRHWQMKRIGDYTRADLIDKGVKGLESWGWGPQKLVRLPYPESTSEGHYLEILHLSDAQIRDTAIIRRSDYKYYDLLSPLSSTLRLELIEDVDSLLLAAILRGYRKTLASYSSDHRKSVLAVHTGDLIDISLVTEMLDATAAVNYACNGPVEKDGKSLPPLPLLSVAGNHDGLTFGVIDDENTTTWEMGINRLEFHLASLALLDRVWPDSIVVHNEAVNALIEGKLDTIPGAPVFSARVLEQRRNSYSDDSRAAVSSTPVAIKARINTPRVEDDTLQPGYFALDRNGFRIIVLDTRSKLTHKGCLELVQLGWLHRELSTALAAHKPVLVFAHHHPRDFASDCESGSRWWSRDSGTFERLLRSFPHVLGYLYGHAHKREVVEENDLLYIQAPSLVDYPQGALLIKVEREPDEARYRITIESVKAGPDRSVGAGLVLDGLQDEALVYAQYDSVKSKTNPEAECNLDYGETSVAQDSCSKGTFNSPPFIKEIVWPQKLRVPSALETLGSATLIKRISEDRHRLLGESFGDWSGSHAGDSAQLDPVSPH